METVRLGGIAHNFLGQIGSVVAAVLPTTCDIFEPTVRRYGTTRSNCQGVNAVSWQNFVPREAHRSSSPSRHGAKAGDIPVEQPTKFDFVINLTTAKALGLTVPPSILSRADELIE